MGGGDRRAVVAPASWCRWRSTSGDRPDRRRVVRRAGRLCVCLHRRLSGPRGWGRAGAACPIGQAAVPSGRPIDPCSAAVHGGTIEGSTAPRTGSAAPREGRAMRTHDHDTEDTALRPKSSRHRYPPAGPPPAGRGRRSQRRARRRRAFSGCSGRSATRGVGRAESEEDRSPVHDVVKSGGGSPLAPDVREEMQGRLGHDFSDVRVHTDSAAHDSAKSVNAHAYTVGSNVVFQRDKYDPSSARGQDDARARADPRRPAAQRSGRRHRRPAAASRSATRPTASSGRRPPTPTG